MAATEKVTFFLDLTPCRLLMDGYQSSGHHTECEGRRVLRYTGFPGVQSVALTLYRLSYTGYRNTDSLSKFRSLLVRLYVISYRA
jgi:hypothetical protein